jgi:hypothetical protein
VASWNNHLTSHDKHHPDEHHALTKTKMEKSSQQHALKKLCSKEYVSGPCVHVLEGHSKAVTVLYFENDMLVHFSFFSVQSIILEWMRKPLAHQVTSMSDKTLCQWDLATGQCMMMMLGDITSANDHSHRAHG